MFRYEPGRTATATGMRTTWSRAILAGEAKRVPRLDIKRITVMLFQRVPRSRPWNHQLHLVKVENLKRVQHVRL